MYVHTCMCIHVPWTRGVLTVAIYQSQAICDAHKGMSRETITTHNNIFLNNPH